MARFTRIPQDPDIDANSAGLARITPIAGVVHDTIGVYSGPDSGDSQYIEDHGLAHIVIGEDWYEWEQLFDTEVFTAHCNGANREAFGCEFSRTYAGQPLTDWQRVAWKIIREEAAWYHGIPDAYLNPLAVAPASVWVNGGNFHGWISHLSVMTDDNSAQHTDYILVGDFVVPAPPVPIQKGKNMLTAVVGNDGIVYVFIVGTDSKVWNNSRLTSGGWTGWSVLPAGAQNPSVRA